ncbi:MAG: CHAT domain-containing protein [Nostoc sp. SerVER01]|nr:adenylate cyclase [Nostoc sp. SerVER01]MDZ8080176.1 adenylate cyclase [Nostoc sp. DcaGUA01]
MQVAVLTIDVQSNQGLTVYLEAGNKGIKGQLPLFSELQSDYQNWQNAINQSANSQFRLESEDTTEQFTVNVEPLAKKLEDNINSWLQHEYFQNIREELIDFLGASKKIPSRIVIKTDDLFLQQLPWYCWNVLKKFPNNEITLSFKTGTIRSNSVFPRKSRIKLLAILGTSSNISINEDIKILKKIESKTKIKIEYFPNKNTKDFPETLKQSLLNSLEFNGYDILFFAGHGVGISNNQTDIIRLQINTSTVDISLSELENALQTAIKKGLRLAIFNSCFGMKIGQTLIREHGLTTISMREKVKDNVAIYFLQNFVENFYLGRPLFLSVKEARKQSLEVSDTWLPVIFQNENAESIKLSDWKLPNILEVLASVALTAFNLGLMTISFAGTLLINQNFWLIILTSSGIISALLFMFYPDFSQKKYLLTISAFTLITSIIFVFIFKYGLALLFFALMPSLVSIFLISLFSLTYYPLSTSLRFIGRFIRNVIQAIR